MKALRAFADFWMTFVALLFCAVVLAYAFLPLTIVVAIVLSLFPWQVSAGALVFCLASIAALALLETTGLTEG